MTPVVGRDSACFLYLPLFRALQTNVGTARVRRTQLAGNPGKRRRESMAIRRLPPEITTMLSALHPRVPVPVRLSVFLFHFHPQPTKWRLGSPKGTTSTRLSLHPGPALHALKAHAIHASYNTLPVPEYFPWLPSVKIPRAQRPICHGPQQTLLNSQLQQPSTYKLKSSSSPDPDPQSIFKLQPSLPLSNKGTRLACEQHFAQLLSAPCPRHIRLLGCHASERLIVCKRKITLPGLG